MLNRLIFTSLALFAFCVSLLIAEMSPAPSEMAIAGGPPAAPAEVLLLNFSLNGTVCDIRKDTYTIIALFPYEIPLDKMIAEFEILDNAAVFIKDVQQISGITVNDFSIPVTYIIRSQSGMEQSYKVRVVFKPEFVINSGINVHPSYNAAYGMVNIGYDGDLFVGGKFNNTLLGLMLLDNYFVFNGQSGGTNISGYWNIARGAFVNSLLLTKYAGLKWGIGGSWIYSQFAYSNITRYTRNNPGFYLQLDLNLPIWRYMTIGIFNQFDLFIDTGNFYPYYKGGIQIEFLNFIQWLRINFGVSGLYSYYQNEGINTTMGILIFDTGIHMDLQFPSLLHSNVKKTQNPGKKKTGTDALKTAQKSDIIEFPDILFKEGTNELTDQSVLTITQIVETLTGRENMEISIRLYSRKTPDPVALLSASIEKLKVIKDRLTAMGIAEARIHVPYEVSILEDNDKENSLLVKIVVLE